MFLLHDDRDFDIMAEHIAALKIYKGQRNKKRNDHRGSAESRWAPYICDLGKNDGERIASVQSGVLSNYCFKEHLIVSGKLGDFQLFWGRVLGRRPDELPLGTAANGIGTAIDFC